MNTSFISSLGLSPEDIIILETDIHNFEKATLTNPPTPSIYNAFGSALYKHGKLEEASQAYSESLKLNPNDWMAHYNRGLILQKQKKLEESVHSYQTAIKLNPKNTRAYNNLGTALKNQGKIEEATKAYNKAASLDPSDVTSYYNMGLVLQKQGKVKEAIKSYEMALKLKPGYGKAYHNLGTALKEQKRLSEAVEAFDKAIEVEPRSVLAYCNRAQLYIELGKEEAALKDFNKAAEIMQSNVLAISLDDEKVDYINQVLAKERQELLCRLAHLQKVAIDTEKLMKGLVPAKRKLQGVVNVFREIKKWQRQTTDDIIESIGKSQEDENPGGEDSTQAAANRIHELEQKLLLLQEQMRAQMDMVYKHENALVNAGVYEKASIKEGFKGLAGGDPRLYIYCKTFYWTLVNYFAAYRSLGTNLVAGTGEVDPPVRMNIFEIGTKAVFYVARELMQALPYAGQAISTIDQVVGNIFSILKKRRFNMRVNAVNMIITYTKDQDAMLEEDISLICASTALKVTMLKKEEIFKLYAPNGGSGKSLEKTYSSLKSKVIKLNNTILPAIGLKKCPATDLALQDVTLLLVYIYANYEEMMEKEEGLVQQFEEIIAKEMWKTLQEEKERKDRQVEEECGSGDRSDKSLKKKDTCNMF